MANIMCASIARFAGPSTAAVRNFSSPPSTGRSSFVRGASRFCLHPKDALTSAAKRLFCGFRIVNMAALVTRNLDHARTLHQYEPNVEPRQLSSTVLLNVVEACLHRSASEWIFLRE